MQGLEFAKGFRQIENYYAHYLSIIQDTVVDEGRFDITTNQPLDEETIEKFSDGILDNSKEFLVEILSRIPEEDFQRILRNREINQKTKYKKHFDAKIFCL